MSTLNRERLAIGLTQALSPWFTGCEQTALVQAMQLTGEETLLAVDSDYAALQAQFTNLYSNNGAAAIGIGDAANYYNGITVEAALQQLARESRDVHPVSVKEYGALGNGINNDTTAFALAFATGRDVFVPPGTYLSDQITVPANRTLFGAGETSIIKPFTVAAGPGTTYQLMLSSGCEVYKLNLITNNATHPNKINYYAPFATDMYLHDVRSEGAAVGFLGYNCTDCVVERMEAIGAESNTITFDSIASTRCVVRNCNVNALASTSGCAIQIQQGIDSMIVGNNVQGGYVFGCFLGEGRNSLIAGNIIRNTRLEGIQMADSNACLASDNIISWDVGFGQDFGISLWAPNAGGLMATCDFNSIVNNTVIGAPKSGISLEGSAGASNSYTKIVGNTVINPNQLAEVGFPGGIVTYGAGINHTLIEGNFCYSNDGKMYHGIREDSSTNSHIVGNRVVGAVTTKVSRAPTATQALNGLRLTDSTWAPVATPTSGAFGATPTFTARYYEVEKMVYFTLQMNVSNIGTAAGAIAVTLPFGAPAPHTVTGVDVGVGNRLLSGSISGTTVVIRSPDGSTTPVATGSIAVVTGWYERD